MPSSGWQLPRDLRPPKLRDNGDKGIKRTFVVDAAQEGVRLDAVLTGHLPALSRSRIQALIESGRITVDGARSRPAARVHRGLRIEVELAEPAAQTLAPESIPLNVLYEDEAVMVINKPAGLAVHPGAGRSAGTLANALLARAPHVAGVGDALRPGIVHRLDKDTSGLLVVAKTAEALASLQEQIASRRAGRHYLALVHGQVPQEEGTIAASIGRHPRHRTKMAVTSTGREAVTRYRVVRRFPRFTLVEAQLVTGRTHQIRVHFAHLGHPVAGDPLYGRRRDELQVGRQALHAWRLRFRHPTRGEEMAFEAPLPADFAAALTRARGEGLPPAKRKRRSG